MEVEQQNSVAAQFEQRITEHLGSLTNIQTVNKQRKIESDGVFTKCQNDLIIRNLYVIVDATKHSMITDFKPTRLGVSIKYIPNFMAKFLEQNPLSQFGLGVALSGECMHVQDFTSSSKNSEQVLSTIKPINEVGFSLYSCIQTALNQFIQSQIYITQQILLITSSPYSEDKKDILDWIDKCNQSGIEVNVISYCGVVRVLQKLAQTTGGKYYCPINEKDFQKLLMSFVLPTKINEKKTINALVQVGFPTKALLKQPTLCMCHLDLIYDYYKCPKCFSKVCNVPMRCPVCDVWLALPSQIMRQSRQDLEVYKLQEEIEKIQCYACDQDAQQAVQCLQCSSMFCIDCDILIHQNLKVCPGCA